ncbi:MAG: alpha/beta fold hydrolase [Clostridia bacterium]|nr:alpha/beta fold hydrolase [Clostridia bacterium]
MIHKGESFQAGKRRILWGAAALLAVIFVLFLLFGLQDRAGPLQGESLPANGDAVRTFTVEETTFLRDGKHIYAKLLLPRGEAPFPLVILAHGFNGNCDKVEPYAMAYAENGIAACVFDFVGGGEGSRSDGSIRDMSVLTEAADLNAVIDSLKQRKEFDPERIFLFGRSQGGFVVAYVAEERPRDVRAMVLLFPGFVISDDMKDLAPDPGKIPETVELMGATVGRIYLEDAMSVDIYEKMGDYPGDVLIFHGTADNIVPLSYSQRAVTAFPSAELVTIEGAGHGFSGEDDLYVTKHAVDFVKAHLDTVS